MKKTQKKAFILNECNSHYIEQAIFILKNGVSTENSAVIADAERIVASYMGNHKHFQKKKTSQKPLLTAILTCIGVLTVLSVCFILR